ncbi:MAG: hypothetical protein JST80_06835 [Bdellovibrionales bacterium]|nr:hypothetical protein [Bdellovibrionales bacterium]
MKKFKAQPQPTQTSLAAKAGSTASQPTNKQEIDAAIHRLSKFIESEPKKAAKIFESWLDSSKFAKKSTIKKRAA